MQSFNLTECNQMSIPAGKEYIKRYFFPLSDGQHVQLEYDELDKPHYIIKDDKTIKSVYFNRLPKELYKFYFCEYDQIKTLTCQLNKPLLFGKYINTCPAMMHDVVSYDESSNGVKKSVEYVLDFLKEVWASNSDLQFEFIVKWLANMARGGKNQSVLYLRGEQGIGKSTFTDFLRKFVIGPQLCIQSGSQPLISNFNYVLFSRLLVIFEELENFSTGQWQGVSTRLKRDTTSDTCTYEDKYQKPIIAKNISNYIINSNVDAIKDDDGRRYFILDLSNKRKGDLQYFDNLHKLCMNDEVGQAFFSYLHTIDLTNYKDQDFPITRAKEDAIVKRLDSVARFLKDTYILKCKDMITTLKDIHLEYIGYCALDGCKDLCKIDFNQRLISYKITSYKSNNTHNKFNYKHKVLDEIARANKWIHATDQYEKPDQAFEDIDLDKDKDSEIKKLKAEIEKLKNLKVVEVIEVKQEIKQEVEPEVKIDIVLMQKQVDDTKKILKENKIIIDEQQEQLKNISIKSKSDLDEIFDLVFN